MKLAVVGAEASLLLELDGRLIEDVLHSCRTMRSSIYKESRMKELNTQLYIMYIMEENWFLQCV